MYENRACPKTEKVERKPVSSAMNAANASRFALGTRLRSGASNECEVNGERVVIKCARRTQPKVGVSYNMLTKLDAVLGAFEEPSGSYWVLRLPAQRCATLMQQVPTASRGPSSGKVGMVNRAVFEQERTLVKVVRV